MRVRLGTNSWTGASQNVSSQWQVFQSLAPAVSALSGSVANIPTAGTVWPNVGVVQVKYMQVRTYLAWLEFARISRQCTTAYS